jgi:hypothetical protein
VRGRIAVEAPGDDGQSKIVMGLAEQKYPGKPWKYLLLDHHHIDHIGGVRVFAAAGATIVVGKGDGAFYRKLLSAPATLNHGARDDRSDSRHRHQPFACRLASLLGKRPHGRHRGAAPRALRPTRFGIQRKPVFKKGTLFRRALDALRSAAEPLTTREVVLAMQVRDLYGGVQSSLRSCNGKSVPGSGKAYRCGGGPETGVLRLGPAVRNASSAFARSGQTRPRG